MTYLASCGALAILEYLVHLKTLPKDIVLMLVEIPDTLEIQKTEWLPADSKAIRQIGDEWIVSKSTAAELEDDRFSIHFDGLKKVDGRSDLGVFHYVPVLFHEGRQILNPQRLLLETHGLLLSRVQGRAPSSGVIYHGSDCRATIVQAAERLLQDIIPIRDGEATPKLLLNDHCTVCEFRRQCHDQAVKEDNLSLLRGLREKEIKSYARKGLFTLTQIAPHVPAPAQG